ncbi:membrane protein [Streptomyces phaeofaciens JCM 4814]|uniref:Membrane protein n=1 Tax=Streptomyces phaeofaciens TaxID=68254 RepID=A0A918HNJ6_9ACTN|nr:hypothetical protein [Streptomyces phaeofaciens]GGT80395.1 membrane protein [Streptomyces phaeofaciens]
MSAHLTTEGWWSIAAGVTVVYMGAMHWCMPTPKARRSMFVAPLAGWIFLLPNAAIKGYSVSHTLFIYSGVLVMFIVMLVPVAKKVAADIAEQEQKPWDKVPLNAFSLYWMVGSATGCVAAVAYLWPFLA